MGFVDDLNPDRFLIAGDWHAHGYQAGAALGLMENIGPDVKVLVHVGDFGIWPSTAGHTFLKRLSEALVERDMWVLFVDGNHEDFNTLLNIPRELDGHRIVRERIVHLPRGFRWNWNGIDFGALGGAHSVDQQWRQPGKTWWAQEWVNDNELARFRGGGPVDVVFMHDSPAGAPNEVVDSEDNQKRAFASYGPRNMAMASDHRRRLASAIDPTDPAMIFHGHYHRRMQGTYTREGGRECTVIGLDQGGSVSRNTFLFDIVTHLPEVSRDFTNA